MADGEGDIHSEEWSRDTQKFAVLTWISFLSAAAFTMLVFAFIDPLILIDAYDPPFIQSRNAGYALGFFLFWAYAWLSGWLVLRLVRRKRNWPRRP